MNTADPAAIPTSAPPPGSVVDRVVGLSRALERAGIPVGVAATIDACAAIEHLDLAHRHELREGLRATLVKLPGQRNVFDAAFDRYFPARIATARPATDAPTISPEQVASAVAGSDDLSQVANDLVDAHGGFDDELRTEHHHVQRVVRAADLARLMSRARMQDPDVPVEQVRTRVDELKRQIAADVRGRLAGWDDEAIALDLVDIEFLTASRRELEDLRSAIRPLARKLATRLARRRQHRRSGRVNMRSTMRRSLATGGVPLDVVMHRPRPHRPELFVLCDVSGSVADVSVFALSLMASLSAELPKTRSFVFVDAIDEVTELLRSTDHQIEPWQLMRNTNVIGADGHTDHDAVLAQFRSDYGADVGPSTTVVVIGDARNNHRPHGVEHLATIADRCRQLLWFNPEPVADWGTTDSEMDRYVDCCTGAYEVRNLRQLIHCIELIA